MIFIFLSPEKLLLETISKIIQKHGSQFEYIIHDFGILPFTILHYKLHQDLYLQLEDEFYKYFEKEIKKNSKILSFLLTYKIYNLKHTLKKLNQKEIILFHNTDSSMGIIPKQIPNTANIILTMGLSIAHNSV